MKNDIKHLKALKAIGLAGEKSHYPIINQPQPDKARDFAHSEVERVITERKAKSDKTAELPTLLGLLENRLNYVGARDKTVKVKITINTARMILAHDKSEQGALCAVAEAAESLSNEWHVVSPSQNVLIFRRKVLIKALAQLAAIQKAS
jgi:hypothetical protein